MSFIISEHEFQNWTYSEQRNWLSELRYMYKKSSKMINDWCNALNHTKVKTSLFAIKQPWYWKDSLCNMLHKDTNIASVS